MSLPSSPAPATAAAPRGWWARLKLLLRGPASLQVLSADGEARYRPIDRKLLGRLLARLWPYRRRYALGIALSMGNVLLEMQGPRFIGWITNWCTNYVTGQGPAGLTEAGAIGHVVYLVGLWAAVAAVALLLQRFTVIIMTAAGERVQFDLRRDLFTQLQRLSMSFYDKTKLGRIISRCTSDVNSMREINVWGLEQVIKHALIVLVAGGMLAATNWRLFLAVVWLAPVLYVVNRIYRSHAAVLWQQVREGYTRVSTNLAENITGVRVVTAFNRQRHNLEIFNNLQQIHTSNNLKAARATGIFQPLLSLIGFTGRAIILLYGGYLVATGHIDPAIGVGSVVTAFLYWDWFMGPVVWLGNFQNQLMMAMAGGERVFHLLDLEPEVQDVPDAVPLPRIRGHVRFEHVTFGYNPARPVLHDIDFAVEPGQMVALVGATGSGKSSIISLLARFYQPQQGRVLVDGHDIRLVKGDSLHHQMGLVLQSNYLFSGSVLDNIRYSRPDATREQVIAAAQALGTYDALMATKDGLDTPVGERGASMSLGQRQIICFTRAFLADPRIFMLDEATSAVDTATERVIQVSLERLLEGRTTFVVAHRLSTIQRADIILVVDHGRIIERGTHAELLASGGKYAHLYEQFVTETE